MNVVVGFVIAVIGTALGTYCGTMTYRWFHEGKPGRSIGNLFRYVIRGHPLVQESRRLGVASLSLGQETRQERFQPQTPQARPSGIRDMLDEAEEEVWLFHLSGGDQVCRNIDYIVRWLFPDTPPAHPRRLRIMAIDPQEQIVESVARLNNKDANEYRREIEEVLSNLNERLDNCKRAVEARFPGRHGSSWQIKVYKSAPPCSIVAVDRNKDKTHILMEFYGYHFAHGDRLCVELTKTRNGGLCQSYLDSFDQLWNNNKDSRDYPQGHYSQ